MAFQYASLNLKSVFYWIFFLIFIIPYSSSQKKKTIFTSNMNRCYHSGIFLYTRAMS